MHVVSKYFNWGKSVMDESLLDFQETKRCHNEPKSKVPPPKSRINTKKTKKSKLKGQKDIRKVIRKNELIQYTKNFSAVCQKSGLDIDAEQLQIAIALSKSEQKVGNSVEPEKYQPLSSQEQTKKIRATLLEYGFKVPEPKINVNVNKKGKKCKKNSKLLNITNEERQQILSVKYAQVLFDNLTSTDCKVERVIDVHPEIYSKATHVQYDLLKNNDFFMVDNLLEKSTTSIGCLLRDWTKIPGRPESPCLSIKKISFSDVFLSDTELDVLLSGTFSLVNKTIVPKQYSHNKIKLSTNDSIKIPDSTESANMITPSIKHGLNGKSMNDGTVPRMQQRSYSPDIFEDESLSIIENTPVIPRSKSTGVIKKETNIVKNLNLETNVSVEIFSLPCSQKSDEGSVELSQKENMTKRISNDFMDFTECVKRNNNSTQIHFKDDENLPEQNHTRKVINILEDDSNPYSQKQKTDIFTLRKSNDFMEITECVNLHSPVRMEKYSGFNKIEIVCDEEIHETKDVILPLSQKLPTENIDITQDHDHDDNKNETHKNKNSKYLEEYHNSNINHDEDITNIHSIAKHSNKMESIECEKCATPKLYGNQDTGQPLTDRLSYQKVNTDHIDLTVNDDMHIEKNATIIYEKDSPNNNSNFEENSTHLHSFAHLKELPQIEIVNDAIEESIDLTQESRSNSHVDNSDTKRFDETVNNSSEHKSSKGSEIIILENFNNDNKLETADGISIKFLDMFTRNGFKSRNETSFENKCKSEISTVYDDFSGESSYSNSKFINLNLKPQETTSSQSSGAVFEISDEELDYSIHKSKLEKSAVIHIDDDAVIVNDLSKRMMNHGPSEKKFVNSTFNRSFSDSYLPTVDIKGTNVKKKSPDNGKSKSLNNTPEKIPQTKTAQSPNKTLQTPKNPDYIIKTSEVTPILDYESLSTPERNKELDKYGLKPFKRKRAIQILKHVYMQTHPIMVNISDEMSLPTKRQKIDMQSPLKNKSPVKGMNNDAENQEPSQSKSEKENLFTVTTNTPVIRHIECKPEDWVFQKREKAKVQGCRVPLHIAFHNYVSSRGALREAILQYRPIDIDVIHKELASYGHKYDPKELLRFLDKKCITVKTADNTRNKKR